MKEREEIKEMLPGQLIEIKWVEVEVLKWLKLKIKQNKI